MGEHERRCFAARARLPLDAVHVFSAPSGRPDTALLKRYDAIFFGGSGAYSVLDEDPWIQKALDTLLEVVDLRIPAWASCFGFHGLAQSLGGKVRAAPELTEMGSTLLSLTDKGRLDAVTCVLPDKFWAQEGHHDLVEELPDAVDLLVTGDAVEFQAFVVRGAPFYASQFHPELTLEGTLQRFQHYATHYVDTQDDTEILTTLKQGKESPELAHLLPRIVWGHSQ